MSDCDCSYALGHLEDAIRDLRRDLDDLKRDHDELKATVADEQRRRRVLSGRVDSNESHTARGRWAY